MAAVVVVVVAENVALATDLNNGQHHNSDYNSEFASDGYELKLQFFDKQEQLEPTPFLLVVHFWAQLWVVGWSALGFFWLAPFAKKNLKKIIFLPVDLGFVWRDVKQAVIV